MQLYNKLSAKERAPLIREAGKDRMTISFYQYGYEKVSLPLSSLSSIQNYYNGKSTPRLGRCQWVFYYGFWEQGIEVILT